MDGTQDTDPRPGGITCEEARAAIGRFLSSGFRMAEDAEAQEDMRRHIQGCEECDEVYREGIETTASMKGALRAHRLREARAGQTTGPGGRPRLRGAGALGVLLTMGGRQPSNKVMQVIWRLRPVLLVAFFFWLMIWITKPGGVAPVFEVQWRSGVVTLGIKPLKSDLPNFGLGDGGDLTTDAEGSARLTRLEAELLVGPDTFLGFEQVVPMNLRLHAGELEVSATGQVTTDLGVVRLDGGRVRLELDPERLRLVVLEGAAVLQDAEGALEVPAGEGLVVERTGKQPLSSLTPD